MKNRNGKPTAFQLNALKDIGFTGKVKTYRDAENTIKRLRRSVGNAIKKGERFETPDGRKLVCTSVKNGVVCAKDDPKAKGKTACSKKVCTCQKKAANGNPIPGVGTFRVILPDSAEGKAIQAVFNARLAQLNQLNQLMGQMTSIMSSFLG